MLRHLPSPVGFTNTVVLTLLLLQGVCVWSDETNISALVGESVELISGYPGEGVDVAEWNFGGKTIAEVIDNKIDVNLQTQFQGRLEMYPSNFSLKVSKLKIEDSGLFIFAITEPNTARFRKSIQLKVYENTLRVHIKPNVTLHQQNNTCTVILLCNTSGPPDAKFSWSGHQEGNGSTLRFPLSPADGSVKVTCAAVRGVNKDSDTVTVNCSNKTNNSGGPGVDISSTEWYLYFVAIPATCGTLVLFFIIAAGVHCHRRHKDDPSEQNTVYADITCDQNKNQMPDNVTADISIYEMVDERAIGIQNQPQTLYDKVNFSRAPKKDVGPTLSSPYQVVL